MQMQGSGVCTQHTQLALPLPPGLLHCRWNRTDFSNFKMMPLLLTYHSQKKRLMIDQRLNLASLTDVLQNTHAQTYYPPQKAEINNDVWRSYRLADMLPPMLT
ncbi:hypothetical protein F2P81_011535 [Scophthalmus maximus]|uniref:Uncharacterized protein n=1 Tax=Scophthalmus maximus TaxID=52904 RepID=A0A6A4SQE1_SCOMX|nr:hypothetical protein F2P81_011535 [Scophthalmus maximus]